MPLGVVIERRDIDNPWQDHAWRAVAVIPGAPEAESWRVLNRGEDWVQYHAATLPLELHRKETEAYKVNLAEQTPVIYVVLRGGEEADDALPIESDPDLTLASNDVSEVLEILFVGVAHLLLEPRLRVPARAHPHGDHLVELLGGHSSNLQCAHGWDSRRKSSGPTGRRAGSGGSAPSRLGV